MRFKKKYFILLFIIIAGCQTTEYQKRVKLENNVISKTIKQWENEKNLMLIGQGGSIVPGNEFIGLFFNYYNPVTIDEARNLIIGIAQDFLSNLIQNENLNNLLDIPYDMNKIEIEIFIYNTDRTSRPFPEINYVNIKNKMLKFYCKNKYLSIDEPSFEIIHEESYEEALKLITKDKK